MFDIWENNPHRQYLTENDDLFNDFDIIIIREDVLQFVLICNGR